MVKSMRALALLGLLLSSTGWAQALTSKELATKAAAVIGIGREGQCSSCHSLNSETTINRWATATKRVDACIAADSSSKEKLACISQSTVTTAANFSLSPSQLGIYAAALHLEPIKTLLTDTFGATDGQSVLTTLNKEVGMPLNSTTRLSTTQFSDVKNWFAAGTPEIAYLLEGEETSTSTCEASYDSTLSSHISAASSDSWKTRIEAQGTAMFGCTAGTCFAQKRNGVDIFPEVSASTATARWKLDASTSMRVLTTITNKRQYWIRSSADGRFVGFGGTPSGIIDLQSLLAATPTQRIISVDALYDPGFLPDDSGFVFQSSTTGMCNMSILRNTATKSISFQEDACTVLSSKIPLYQTIGASLNGEDYMALTSSYQRDSGTTTTLDEFIPSEDVTASSQNKLNLYDLAFDGQSWVRKTGQSFATPYEIDWVLSHSNQLGMSRLQAERDGIVRTNGFKLYKFGKDSAGKFTKTNIATLCGDGLKGDFSYDERFYINYSYIRADQWKSLGYASANDPAFQAKLKTGSADLILYDLYTKKNYALTNVNPDQYAIFPHFRADNWIYFEVYDRATGKRTVVASDAAVQAERKAPTN